MSRRTPDIRNVTAGDLITLEPLLRASFGRYDFELEEEISAFAATDPHDWFVLFDGSPQGFVRSFPVDENLYVGELYTVPGPERAGRLEHLLRHVVQHHKLPTAATLRVNVPRTDHELAGLLASLFPAARTKTFVRYHLRTPHRAEEKVASPVSVADLSEIQAVLEPLKHYSLLQLEHLARTQQLCVHKDNGVKAALHAAPYEAGLEVVTLATAPSYLRRGYAAALLKTFLDANPDTSVVLKVNVENTAAISLYEHNGFTRQNDLTEVWWYLPL